MSEDNICPKCDDGTPMTCLKASQMNERITASCPFCGGSGRIVTGKLNERQELVIKRRGEGRTYREIGLELAVTPSRAREIFTEAHHRVRFASGYPVKLDLDRDSPEITVMVRQDEARYIKSGRRCSTCGHHSAFHHEGLDNILYDCDLCECDGIDDRYRGDK